MIQQSHLTAWQSHAPWPRRSQIEQDLRLSRGVAAIFADPVLGEYLAMRGGTVLHKAHLAPAARYSEDIDLVLVKTMDTDTLDRHLRRVLAPVLGQPADSLIADAWLTIRNALRPSRILRTAYTAGGDRCARRNGPRCHRRADRPEIWRHHGGGGSRGR